MRTGDVNNEPEHRIASAHLLLQTPAALGAGIKRQAITVETLEQNLPHRLHTLDQGIDFLELARCKLLPAFGRRGIFGKPAYQYPDFFEGEPSLLGHAHKRQTVQDVG